MKLALITGASSGLGRELAKLLSQKGYELILTGRKELPPAYRTLQADLVHERGRVIELVREYAPELVINSAGFGLYGEALGHKLDMLELNATAAIEITIEAARVLREKGKEGVILNVSSLAGELSTPYLALYSAAKACLTSFSKSFDAEMRGEGIRILVSLPGPIDTPFARRASQGKYEGKGGMKKEVVAREIWRQTEKRKGVEIIGWRNKLAWLGAKLFPGAAERLVAREIRRRVE